jgi:hypothetical protein
MKSLAVAPLLHQLQLWWLAIEIHPARVSVEDNL